MISQVTNRNLQTAKSHGWIGTGTVKSRAGDFKFKNGYPADGAAGQGAALFIAGINDQSATHRLTDPLLHNVQRAVVFVCGVRFRNFHAVGFVLREGEGIQLMKGELSGRSSIRNNPEPNAGERRFESEREHQDALNDNQGK